MEPVLDTADLAAIAGLADVDVRRPSLADLGTGDRARYRAQQIAYDEARWVRAARRLAAMGVTPAPSHDVGMDGTMRPSVWGAFWDSEDLSRIEARAGRTYPGAPLVVFGVEVDPGDIQERMLPQGYRWVAVGHQTAGVACHHRHLIGICLSPRPERYLHVDALGRFAHDRAGGCVGPFGLGLSEVVAYASLVDELGLSAEFVWQDVEEGCSPLDVRCASLLSDTAVPGMDELYPVPEGVTGLEALRAGPPLVGNPWRVWVLGENCD